MFKLKLAIYVYWDCDSTVSCYSLLPRFSVTEALKNTSVSQFDISLKYEILKSIMKENERIFR